MTNEANEPAYTPPATEEIVLPEEVNEPDVFDDEVGTAEDIEADFDTPETNAKEDTA
jgi:hypothetical protein